MINPNSRAFLVGVILGASGGLVLGSLLGLQLGERAVTLARRLVARALRREERVRFELLLQ